MEIESNESKFILNEDGICIDLQPRQTGVAEELIEQLMITANQAAAKLAAEKKLSPLSTGFMRSRIRIR